MTTSVLRNINPMNREPGPLRNGNPRGNPNAAPRCGAKARTTGCACRAPAMANGRCLRHGGRSTGPRTPQGMARMAAAHTTHGRYSAAGAPQRANHRHVRTIIVRLHLLATATLLQEHLPPQMALRLDQGAPELYGPKHPSRVAFEAQATSTPCNVRPRGGRTAGTAPATTPGPTPNWRDTERAASLAERAAHAPWKAAITFARAAKRAARQAREQSAAHKARGPRIDPPRIDPMNREPSDAPRAGNTATPMLQLRPEGERLAARSPRRPAANSPPVDNNPLYRELALRAAGLRASPPPVSHPACKPAACPRPARPGSIMATALQTTTLARTWDALDLRAQLAAQFGPAATRDGAHRGLITSPQQPHEP
jgi:hypothetical protein